MLRVNHLSGFGRIIPAVGGGGFDSDAQAFFTATGISDSTIQNAIDALVIGLKADSVWSKFDAIYPFVGGSSSTHLVNLKNPGTHNISWSGTVTHSSNGIVSNGTDGYGDSNWNHSTHGADDDEHLSVYCGTDAAANVSAIGCNGFFMQPRRGSGNFRAFSQAGVATEQAVSDSLGYFSINRTASAGLRMRQNGTNYDKTQDSTDARQNLNVYICCGNAGSPSAFTTRSIRWAAIGAGLTETEDGNVRTRVETFQDALSRGVV